MELPQLKERLINLFLNQKDASRARHGLSPLRNERALRAVLEEPAAVLAQIVEKYRLEPGQVMAAIWALSDRNRQPDGPYMNILKSENNLRKALAFHLNVPLEAAFLHASVEKSVERVEADYQRAAHSIARRGQDGRLADLVTIPATYRFVYSGFDTDLLVELCDQVIDEIKGGSSTGLWLATKDWTLDDVLLYKQP